MTPAGAPGADGGLIQRVEALLESLTAVAAARVLFDEERGIQVHIIATSEMPVSEVSRAALSVLTWGLGFDVAPERVIVVQSRLSRDELNNLLDRKKTESPTHGKSPEGRLPSPLGPQASVSATGLLEFSIGGSDGSESNRSELDRPRLKLDDFQILRRSEGGYAFGVRLREHGTSVPALREGGETEADMLELPANAALDAIQEFLRRQRSDGPGVSLKLLGARRLRDPPHDVVVVLIEAVVNGRNVPLTGAACAEGGVPHASVLATLQATNAFVAGTLLPEQPGGTKSEWG